VPVTIYTKQTARISLKSYIVMTTGMQATRGSLDTTQSQSIQQRFV